MIRTMAPLVALLALPLATQATPASSAFPGPNPLATTHAAPTSLASRAPSVQAAPAAAASSGWQAWLGCWRPVGEAAPADALVCVVPGQDAQSVRMISLEDGAIIEESVMRADGTARPVTDGGCTGTESAAWSQDGRRVFVRTELDCDGMRRTSTGVIAMIAENEWVDVQAVEIAGQHAARSVRYRAVRSEQVPPEMAALLPTGQHLLHESARLHASAPLDIAAVIEASRQTSAPVVEGLVAARQNAFGLNARRLLELEAAGVPTSVIDMMVAVSNPQRFAVREQPREERQATALRPTSSLYTDCRDPYTFRRMTRLECERMMQYGYGSYGYNSYGSSRFGYSPWGYDPYGWRYGNSPIVVIVQPDREERRGGQMVRGQGYTQGSGATTTRGAQPRDQATSRPADTGSSAARPAATSGSGSTNDTGTNTGRRAVPRTGGGGDTSDGG
jgi:hypothetical protein